MFRIRLTNLVFGQSACAEMSDLHWQVIYYEILIRKKYFLQNVWIMIHERIRANMSLANLQNAKNATNSFGINNSLNKCME